MYNNQFYGQRQYQPMYQPQQYQPIQQIQPVYQGIQGRIVDNIEVVKATEISLDGSVSYFPIADGSAIVTKQLQSDGTSKLVVYKPEATPKAVTTDELESKIASLEKEITKINQMLGDVRYDKPEANSYEYDTKQQQSYDSKNDEYELSRVGKFRNKLLQ